MKSLLDIIKYTVEHFQGSMQFLVVLVASFPFIVIVVMFSILMGLIPSPIITLTESMTQINRVALEYYDLLKTHSKESKRKDQLIQYLVLENCRRDHKKDQSKCERLEQTLRELGP